MHIAIDVGAFSTDVVAFQCDADGKRGAVDVCKTNTTCSNVGQNILRALRTSGIELSGVSKIVVGTTLPTDEVTIEEYSAALKQITQEKAFRGSLYFMQANGGMTCFGNAKNEPIALLSSGSVGGLLAARALGNLIGEKNFLALDIGATTAKCTLVRDGKLPFERYPPAMMGADTASITLRTTFVTTTVVERVLTSESAKLAQGVRDHCARNGLKPSECALMAFGGGGAVHAAALAYDLEIARVIIPVNEETFSAWGLLLADMRRDYTSEHLNGDWAICASYVAEKFEQLRNEALRDYRINGLSENDWHLEYYFHVYCGAQVRVLKLAGAESSFIHAMQEFLADSPLNTPIHHVAFRLVANSNITKPTLPIKTSTGRPITEAKLRDRKVNFSHFGDFEAAVYDRNRLEPGVQLKGPAVIQGTNSTVLVPPSFVLTVDSYCNLIIEPIEVRPAFNLEPVL